MIKIRDILVGASVAEPFLLKTVTLRRTKPPKNAAYLALEFTDGTTVISGNYWNWDETKSLPPVGTVYTVYATVSEWAGNKQFTIQKLVVNTEVSVDEFMPACPTDSLACYLDAMKMINDMNNVVLRKLTGEIYTHLKTLLLYIPGAKELHHAFVAGTLVHSLSVAKIANAMAKNIDGADVDLATAGALLHDIGKLFTYQIIDSVINMTDEGQLYDHLYIGARFVDNFADNNMTEEEMGKVVPLLVHIILSHHGKLEYGAVVTPRSVEAHIVHHADAIDAAAQMIREVQLTDEMWTGKIWALDNRPAITMGYTAKATEPKDDLPF